MNCQEYLARFSDVLDGRAEEDICDAAEAHRRACGECDQYSHALEAGRELLQALPALEVPSDFHQRLQHRILHLKDGSVLRSQSLGSGTTVSSLVLVAALIAGAAWAPALDGPEPTVDLPAVVVLEPPAPSFQPDSRRPTFSRNLSFFSTTEFREGIWGDSHDLLRQYSPILDRRGGHAFVRTGIE